MIVRLGSLSIISVNWRKLLLYPEEYHFKKLREREGGWGLCSNHYSNFLVDYINRNDSIHCSLNIFSVCSVTQNEGSQIKPQISTIQQEIEKLLL